MLLRKLGQGIAYLYVAVALAPLVLLAVSFGVIMATGGSPWPYWRYTADQPIGPIKEEVTFRTNPLTVQPDKGNATRRYVIGVGKAMSSGARRNPPITPADTFYVVAPEVEHFLLGPTQVGDFNNVLVTQASGLKKLFPGSASAKLLSVIDTSAGKAVLIVGTTKDSDADGKVTSKDLHTIFLYLLNNDELRQVANVPGNVVWVDGVSEEAALVIRAAQDSDGDGRALRSYPAAFAAFNEEPQALYRVDLKTLEASPIVLPALIDDLQKTIDASQSERDKAPAQ